MRFLEPVYVLLGILCNAHLRLYLQILVISSKSSTPCEELREPAAPGVLAASLVARFPRGPLTGASGSRAGSGFRASWARGVPATSASTVGGAQVPQYTLPWEGPAAALTEPPTPTLSAQAARLASERKHTDVNNYTERAILRGGSWPILSEDDQQRLLCKLLWGGLRGHSPETTQVQTGF